MCLFVLNGFTNWVTQHITRLPQIYLFALDELPQIELRLVDGSSNSEGRIEISYNGEWGTICDDGWTDYNARVVCRQLGFKATLGSTLRFGPGNGTIWLDNVACTGNETTILKCRHRGLGKHFCGHYEDIGVMCTSKSSVFLQYTYVHITFYVRKFYLYFFM